MAHRTVTLHRKCKTPQGWRYYPVAMSANGKVKPNKVMVQDVEMDYPKGHYVLRSYRDKKTIWTRINGEAREALAALKTAQKIANAVAVAGKAKVEVVIDQKRIVLADAIVEFVSAAADRKSPEAAEIYKRTLDDFMTGCGKTYADELTLKDVTAYHGQMRKRGLADRTVHNRHMSLRAFLIYLKLDYKAIAGPSPKFEKTMPGVYTPEDLRAFFGGLDSEYDRVFYKLLLTTGLREREAMHLEWTDIRTSEHTLKVESKPRWGHRIKDAEEREMPLSDEVLAMLEAYRKTIAPGHRLLFGTRSGAEDKPDGHHLRNLKLLVRKLGLNCGECGTCVKRRECERWFLHKFRATYITNMLRQPDMDLRTVMELSGHADIESVMRYLRPAEKAVSQRAINTIKWY
jgi:integrase